MYPTSSVTLLSLRPTGLGLHANTVAGRCVSHKTPTCRSCCTQPVVYLVNLSANDFIRKKNKWLAKIHAWIQVGASWPWPCPASRHNPPPALLESWPSWMTPSYSRHPFAAHTHW